MQTNAKEVAETIIEQLGGAQFAIMTGVKAYSYGTTPEGLPALFVKFRSRMQGGINHLTVALNGLDLYDLTYQRVLGPRQAFAASVVATQENVYADKLRAMFTAATGYETSL